MHRSDDIVSGAMLFSVSTTLNKLDRIRCVFRCQSYKPINR